jgi:DNA-binding CsgD family transcriptional regulator
VLRGRAPELERLEQLLRDVRAGDSRALVVSGEAGIGKSVLLEDLTDRATGTGCRVVRAAGIQAEAELPFAALHQLCTPLLDRLGHLPEPQRDALGTTFGLRTGPAPDPFMLGLAVLGLVADVATERPLICVVDDAQWLDHASAQVMGFVARRLGAESVAFVFARREADRDQSLTALPEMVLGGLRAEDARQLLASVIPGPLDPRVRDRIVAETCGNPLALLELPRGLTHAELAGGFGLSGADGLSGRIEDSFRRRLAQLSSDQRRFALLAAAEPLGDPGLLRRATERLRIHVDAMDPAAFDGLLQWGTLLTFRHPLVRSATYRSASPDERRAAHRALADVTDPVVDPDRRAWHLAEAAAGPDEEIATELERSAGRAQARGGLAAAAAFLERAAGLTPEPAVRAVRSLAAAEAKLRAGAPEAAWQLLSAAQAGPLGELHAARLDLLHAQIAYAQNRGDDAPPLLLRAAQQLEPLDLRLARDTYLDALAAANFAGGVVTGGLVAAAEAARRAPAPATARPSDMLLEGLAVLVTEGYAAGVPPLQRALVTFRSADISGEEILRWSWLATRTAVELWDYDAWREFADRMVEVARDLGALAALPLAFALQTGTRIYAGDLEASAALNEETDTVVEATGLHIAPYGAFFLSAWRGREAEASAVIDAAIEDATSRGEGLGVTAALVARAILYNGLGHHDKALAAAERASEHPEDLAFHNWALVELVEAAARCRQPDRGIAAVELLADRTGPSGNDWARGIEARSRAMVSDDDDAEHLHSTAISCLGRTRVRIELARAHLVYGEWLRRRRRRVDARKELRRAHEMFVAMGVEAFAERARSELAATGERARKRTVETESQLTNREAQVARLAGDGLSNPDIGARLFLSPRTVEYHLRKVFTKLDIASRTQLHDVLGGPPRR